VENVFSYGTGLRALGMGSAFIAMTDDPYLGYWNPGAAAYNQYKEVSVFGTRLIADTYYFSGFYTNPTLNIGTFSVGGIGVYSDGIESYDENASPITGASTSYFQSQILISYGYGFRWGLGIGGTAKIEQLRITDYKGAGVSFDIGVYYHPQKVPWLSVGAVVQDLYSTGIKLLEEFEKNTRVCKLGVATPFTWEVRIPSGSPSHSMGDSLPITITQIRAALSSTFVWVARLPFQSGSCSERE
jgi:hypothetical protein